MPVKTLTISCLIAYASAAIDRFTIDPATRTIRDSHGRVRIFHGQNVVVKLPNYLPTTDAFNFEYSMTAEDFTYLKSWGTKIIRLGVMWESVERSPGVYDMDYLAKVENLINQLGENDMTVIVDNH
jgi:endoglycosylceramidase